MILRRPSGAWRHEFFPQSADGAYPAVADSALFSNGEPNWSALRASGFRDVRVEGVTVVNPNCERGLTENRPLW